MHLEGRLHTPVQSSLIPDLNAAQLSFEWKQSGEFRRRLGPTQKLRECVLGRLLQLISSVWVPSKLKWWTKLLVPIVVCRTAVEMAFPNQFLE